MTTRNASKTAFKGSSYQSRPIGLQTKERGVPVTLNAGNDISGRTVRCEDCQAVHLLPIGPIWGITIPADWHLWPDHPSQTTVILCPDCFDDRQLKLQRLVEKLQLEAELPKCICEDYDNPKCPKCCPVYDHPSLTVQERNS